MKRVIISLCLAAIVLACAPALAQDYPVPGFGTAGGTAGGSNFRAYLFGAPYIFGNGCNIQVKWKRDLDAPPYDTRRTWRHNFVFDENGFLYWRAGFNAAQTQSGIIKTNPADGDLVWLGAVPDTASTTVSPIVGGDFVYGTDYAESTVYALNKADGSFVWMTQLPEPVQINMSLHDGTLYGVTRRDPRGSVFAFAIRAADGFLHHATPILTTGDLGPLDGQNTVLIPDKFGEREHGLYWYHNGNGAEAIYGVVITLGGAGKVWSSTPIRTASSHLIYNPRAKSEGLYALHWSDYGSTVESYNPITGAKRWVATTGNLGASFNGGFYPVHTLKVDWSGFIFAGFGHDVWSITDPGDLGGGNLTMADVDWFYDGLDVLGESQWMGLTIVDSVGGREIFISGTGGRFDDSDPNNIIDEKRRLFAMDLQTGQKIWEWFNPGDVAPYTAGYNFRALSVGPDGTLYYFDAEEPAGGHGTLYAITAVPGLPGDVDGNGVVDGLDLTAVISAFGTIPGDSLWNEDADLDCNGIVDGLDLTAVISNWTVSGAAAAEPESAKPGKRLGNVRKGL
jgi:outer membrane protein assembly factor BamB